MAAQLLTLSLAVTLTLITLSARCTDAVQCYSCESQAHGACGDPFNHTAHSVSKCPGNTCTKAKTTENGQTLFARGCRDDSIQEQCDDDTTQGVITRICACSHDLCNAAAGLHATTLWAAGAAAAALYSARR